MTQHGEPTFETIERVASAICASESGHDSYGLIDEWERSVYRRMARAAILALNNCEDQKR